MLPASFDDADLFCARGTVTLKGRLKKSAKPYRTEILSLRVYSHIRFPIDLITADCYIYSFTHLIERSLV